LTPLAIWAITVYAGQYVGQPLFCGGIYTDTTGPWFALPIETHGTDWQCGDLWCVWADGEEHCAPARDSGPFGNYCVVQPDGTCPRIAVDVPQPWAWFGGLSTTAERAYNWTRLEGELVEGIWGWGSRCR